MGKTILSPRSDFVFKRIFGNQANADILAEFLLSVLSLSKNEYDTLTIIDPHLNRMATDGKMSILDVKLRTRTGKIIDIEINISPMSEMRERIIYYTARMITEQMEKGDRYSAIKKVVSIVITDYVMVNENKKYHNRYTMFDKINDSEFTDIIEIDTLELPKLAAGGDGSALSDWMQFLKSQTEEELTMLAQKSAPLNKAVGVLLELSADEQTRLLYEAHEKARMDEDARTRYAIKIRETEFAKKLLAMGMSIDEVIEASGLSIDEVNGLSFDE